MKILAATTVLAAGCASTADINLSQADQQCGQACSSNYQQCMSKFTIFPIMAQHQCTDVMRLCAQTCPERK